MVTWQMTRQGQVAVRPGDVSVRQADVAVYMAHTWANHMPTRGILALVGKGATWPNPGLPRGTPLLVRWFGLFKICYGGAGGRTRDLRWANGLTHVG